MAKKITIPRHDPSINKSGVIRITPEAVDALLEVSKHTNMGIRQIASHIIVQAVNNNMIEYGEDE